MNIYFEPVVSIKYTQDEPCCNLLRSADRKIGEHGEFRINIAGPGYVEFSACPFCHEPILLKPLPAKPNKKEEE